MNCPKCISPMVQINFFGVEVDRCAHCQGLFFDDLNRAKLQKARRVDALDIGDARLGREFNQVGRIDCPRCGSRMIRMVDLDQKHIWFEHCTVCNGSFFDAGEFKDLARHTILDVLKDLATPARH